MYVWMWAALAFCAIFQEPSGDSIRRSDNRPGARARLYSTNEIAGEGTTIARRVVVANLRVWDFGRVKKRLWNQTVVNKRSFKFK